MTTIPARLVELIQIWSGGRVRLIPFGSRRLLGNLAELDLDILCICPNVTRADVFRTLPFLLEQAGVQKVVSIPTAFVPVIKFQLDRVDVDMIFACVTLSPDVRATTLDQLALFANGPEDVRSLQGSLATEKILALASPYPLFPALLLATKRWAIRRNIYSNALGLFNGVALAMMCLHVCISNAPHQEPCTEHYLFRQFVETFADWNWSTHALTVIPHASYPVQTQVMNIYTPVDPTINILYNTGRSQHDMIVRELQFARDFPLICTAPAFPAYFTKELGAYVVVRASSLTEKAHAAWKAWVESKMRLLVTAPLEWLVEPCTRCYSLTPTTTLFFAWIHVPVEWSAESKRETCERVQSHFCMRVLRQESADHLTVDLVKRRQLPPFVLLP